MSKAQSVIAQYSTNNNSDKSKSTTRPIIKKNQSIATPPNSGLKKQTSSGQLSTKLNNKVTDKNVTSEKKFNPKPTISRPQIQQATSSSLLNTNKKKQPVFMNAPYKTENVNNFKRSKSAANILRQNNKAETTFHDSNLHESKREAPEQLIQNRESFKSTTNLQETNESSVFKATKVIDKTSGKFENKPLKSDFELVKKQKIEYKNFSEIGPTLSLPPRLSNSINNSFKLTISLNKEIDDKRIKQQSISSNEPNMFIQKMNQRFQRQAGDQQNKTHVLLDNMNVLKSKLAYKKSIELVDRQFFELNYHKDKVKDMSKGNYSSLVHLIRVA